MKIIMTGSEGMIGTKLKNKLDKYEYDLICTDFDLSEKEYPDLKISDEYIVIHIAGEKSNDPEALSKNNILATDYVIDNLCKNEKCKGLIYFSSIAVFGIQDEIITENSSKKPDNFYGFSKLICENLIKSKLKNKWHTILRPTNVISKSTSTLVGYIVDCIKTKEVFEAWKSSLATKRDYIWIDDVVNTVVKILEEYIKGNTNESLEVNLAMGKSYSLKEIIEITEKVAGKKLKMNVINTKEFRGKDLYVKSPDKLNVKDVDNEFTSLKNSIKKIFGLKENIKGVF